MKIKFLSHSEWIEHLKMLGSVPLDAEPESIGCGGGGVCKLSEDEYVIFNPKDYEEKVDVEED